MVSHDFYGMAAEAFIGLLTTIMQRPIHRKALDASRGELGLLILLSAHPDGMSAGSIKEELNISSSGVANILKQAEQKGLISRSYDSADHRRVITQLTKAGMAEAQKHSALLHQTILRLMQELGEEDAAHLLRIFEKLTELSQSCQL